MKNETKIDEQKKLPEDKLEVASTVKDVLEPAPIDEKELARQRSKEDLARKRRDMHQNRGKR